jgi:hypothetical protein
MKTISTNNNGKKTSLIQSLESAIAARRSSGAELVELGKLMADKSARKVALETAGDLNDAAVIAEIGQLQVFAELLPRRIAVKEGDDAKAEEALTQATNQFIHEHLGPRVRRLAARTEAIVKSELSPHYRDPAALTIAVLQSERVQNLKRLSWSATLRPERGALAHADGALKAWAAVDEFEKALAVGGD